MNNEMIVIVCLVGTSFCVGLASQNIVWGFGTAFLMCFYLFVKQEYDE